MAEKVEKVVMAVRRWNLQRIEAVLAQMVWEVCWCCELGQLKWVAVSVRRVR